MPFHWYGLWLAVMRMPPAAPRWRTRREIVGVGQGLSASHTGVPVEAISSATAAATLSDAKRWSYPTSTPLRASSLRTTYRAIERATMRAFANVKSSAITPRQPSVPNLIAVIKQGKVYAKRYIRQTAGLACLRRLKKRLAAILFQPFHDFSDVLGAVARHDEQGVRSFDHDEVAHADGRDKFLRAVKKIARAVYGVTMPSENIFAGLLAEQLVNRGPRADVAPADFRGNHENLRGTFLARSRFENGVIHGNIFESGIYSPQVPVVAARANGCAKFFERSVCLRQKSLEIIEKRRDAPEKHSRVPVIVAGSYVLLREFESGLFREALYGERRELLRIQSVADSLDIAKSSVRTRRRDTEHHHASRRACHLERRAHDAPVHFWLRDVVVCGQHGHQRVAFGRMTHVQRGKRDCCGRVSSDGLGENAFARRSRNLFFHRGGLFNVRDRPDAVGRNQRTQPRDRLLEHRVFAHNVEQLLRRSRTATRPKPRPAPSGQNHHMSSQQFLPHFVP